MAKKGLGKGLDSLIGPSKVEPAKPAVAAKTEDVSKREGVTMVKITSVEPNREQPRRKFDEDALQ
jgi:ParB family chromosome partitioning protein